MKRVVITPRMSIKQAAKLMIERHGFDKALQIASWREDRAETEQAAHFWAMVDGAIQRLKIAAHLTRR